MLLSKVDRKIFVTNNIEGGDVPQLVDSCKHLYRIVILDSSHGNLECTVRFTNDVASTSTMRLNSCCVRILLKVHFHYYKFVSRHLPVQALGQVLGIYVNRNIIL